MLTVSTELDSRFSHAQIFSSGGHQATQYESECIRFLKSHAKRHENGVSCAISSKQPEVCRYRDVPHSAVTPVVAPRQVVADLRVPQSPLPSLRDDVEQHATCVAQVGAWQPSSYSVPLRHLLGGFLLEMDSRNTLQFQALIPEKSVDVDHLM